MSKNFKIIYSTLYSALILMLVWAWVVYTSLYDVFPWYESSGMQLIATEVLISPVLLVIGIVMFGLNKHLKSKDGLVWLPFVSIIAVVLPEYLSLVMINEILLITVAYLLLSIIAIKKIFKLFK